MNPRSPPARRLRPLAALLLAVAMAATSGCFGAPEMPNSVVRSGDIQAQNRTVEPFRIDVPAHVSLEIYTRLGEVGVILLEAHERDSFLAGEPVKELWDGWYEPDEDNSIEHSAELAAGYYVIGLSCTTESPCKYRLDLKTNAPAEKFHAGQP